MNLKFIFRGAALMAVHTGVAAGVAAAMGSDNPLAVGFTSFAVGVPSLIVGAFAGDAVTYQPRNDSAHTDHPETGAYIGGMVGYAAGSMIGFALKFS